MLVLAHGGWDEALILVLVAVVFLVFRWLDRGGSDPDGPTTGQSGSEDEEM